MVKKILFHSTWWICAVRDGEELLDSFYATQIQIEKKYEKDLKQLSTWVEDLFDQQIFKDFIILFTKIYKVFF